MINNGFFAIVVALIITSCSFDKTADKFDLNTLLTFSEVGATVMPKEIAPVSAPFETVEFVRPTFKSDSVFLQLSQDVMSTQRIQIAIDSLTENGGGVVVVPSGRWLSGRIELKSNVNLYFQDGAELEFSGDVEDFKPAVYTRQEGIELMSVGGCIYANGQHNIAVTGKGLLIGPGKGNLRDRLFTHEVIGKVVDISVPIEERVYIGDNEDWIFPPMFISPINCEKVFIEGISLENSIFWNIVPIFCNNVIIRGVTVNSVGTPRGDGIDVESSQNVLIEYSTLNTGDDCFTIKSGRGLDGVLKNHPAENIVVRYCLALEGHGGITCGSETAGTIRNVYVHDCVFKDTGVGINFKTRRPRGGGVENLTYERIRMDLRYTAIKWDMLGDSIHVGEMANRLPVRDVNELTPFYRNIHIKDVLVENSTHFLKVIGIPESPLTNVHMSNIKANSSQLITVSDADNIILNDVEIFTSDSLIEMVDARNILFNKVKFNSPSTIQLDVSGDLSDSILFINVRPEKLKNWVKQ